MDQSDEPRNLRPPLEEQYAALPPELKNEMEGVFETIAMYSDPDALLPPPDRIPREEVNALIKEAEAVQAQADRTLTYVVPAPGREVPARLMFRWRGRLYNMRLIDRRYRPGRPRCRLRPWYATGNRRLHRYAVSYTDIH